MVNTDWFQIVNFAALFFWYNEVPLFNIASKNGNLITTEVSESSLPKNDGSCSRVIMVANPRAALPSTWAKVLVTLNLSRLKALTLAWCESLESRMPARVMSSSAY
ncbi:hypothetical protein TNCV_1421401 [Trichonephila clavipes]|nr:hypothetical protein TNCV_1421401 [Trichonephila clavipes]